MQLKTKMPLINLLNSAVDRSRTNRSTVAPHPKSLYSISRALLPLLKSRLNFSGLPEISQIISKNIKQGLLFQGVYWSIYPKNLPAKLQGQPGSFIIFKHLLKKLSAYSIKAELLPEANQLRLEFCYLEQKAPGITLYFPVDEKENTNSKLLPFFQNKPASQNGDQAAAILIKCPADFADLKKLSLDESAAGGNNLGRLNFSISQLLLKINLKELLTPDAYPNRSNLTLKVKPVMSANLVQISLYGDPEGHPFLTLNFLIPQP